MNEEIIIAYNDLKKRGIITKQQDVVNKTGIHKTTLSEILNNKKKAGKTIIRKWENAFGKLNKVDKPMMPEFNGNGDRTVQVTFAIGGRTFHVNMPKDYKKEDIEILMEHLKLMLKSMQ